VIRAPFELIVALRFLREGRMQSALILGGVAIGVAVVVFITGLVKGLQSSLVERTLGSQAHIVIRPPEEKAQPVVDRAATDVAARVEARPQRLRSIDQWEAMLPRLARTPGVLAASPMAEGAAFAQRGTASKSVALRGVDPERYRRIVRMDENMVAGEFRVAGTDAVIGIELAKDLGVAVGDKVRVATPEGREEVVTVAGIFDIGNKELNRRWVFVTLKLAQTLLDLPGGVSSLEISVGEIFSAEPIAARIEGETGLLAESWMKTNAQLLAAMRNQDISTGTIRVFVTLVVALGIASVLVVWVVQKQKEIGILRAMGASRLRIMLVFLLQGGIVALAGSVAGSLLAAVLVRVFARIFVNADGTPMFLPEVGLSLLVTTWGVALLTGLASAALPARRAAHLDPVQAIRSG
jgi:lipoprotein-releasing system permease protein